MCFPFFSLHCLSFFLKNIPIYLHTLPTHLKRKRKKKNSVEQKKTRARTHTHKYKHMFQSSLFSSSSLIFSILYPLLSITYQETHSSHYFFQNLDSQPFPPFPPRPDAVNGTLSTDTERRCPTLKLTSLERATAMRFATAIVFPSSRPH